MRKRSLTLSGHRTSLALEEPFWTGLEDLAARRQMPLSALVSEIDRARTTASLSSAVRLTVLEWYQHGAQGAISSESSVVKSSRN